MNFLNKITGTAPTPYQNPFQKDNFVKANIYIYSGKGGFLQGIGGAISFENGNSSGEQKFNATSLEDLFVQMKAFTDAL